MGFILESPALLDCFLFKFFCAFGGFNPLMQRNKYHPFVTTYSLVENTSFFRSTKYGERVE